MTNAKTVKLVPTTDIEDMLELAADDNIRLVNEHSRQMKYRAAMEAQHRKERRTAILDRALDVVVLAGVIFGLAVALSCLL